MISPGCGAMILQMGKRLWHGGHLTGQTTTSVFPFAMRMFTTTDTPRRKATRHYALAVTLLAFGLFAQAVHAKNADYFPTAPHSTRYSTTIKIADLARHVVVEPGPIAVLRGIVPPVAPRQIKFISYTPELRSHELSAQISFRPLRSPPVDS